MQDAHDRALGGADFAGAIDDALRAVDDLIDRLEPTLGHEQIRLLHQIRLASETVGALRASAHLHGVAPPT